MPEPLPATIGKYQVQSSLGEGGFGRVFKAFDPTVGRLVAVKVLTAQGGPGLLARFQNEASAAGNLHHENIVTIYEFGEFNGSPFIAMEYLEGNDLNVLMYGKRNLTLLDKVRIMTQVGEGISCAHENGVIHRDIKPANIKILTNGSVKIMDFGIARLTRDDSTRLTNKGDLLGTIRYMCCDQFKGMEADVLSDVFAFGVVFYELVAGLHPFEGADAGAFMYKITTQEPVPLSDLVPGCPHALNQIVLKTLEKDRDLRYQSLEDLLLDMRPLLFELQRGRAAELLVQARMLFDSGQVAQAQVCMREVIDLDPSNKQAWELREQIQQSAQRRTLRPKVEALLKTAESDLSGNLYHQAIEALEAAAKLDPTNPNINTRIKAVRQQLEITQQVAKLVADAQREFDRQNVTLAERLAAQAMAIDPANRQAASLVETIRRDIEHKANQRRIKQCLESARSLLKEQNFDSAAELLEGVSDIPDPSGEVAALKAQLDDLKASRLRQERLRVEKAAIQKTLKASHFMDALPRLEALCAEFPEDPDLPALLAGTRNQVWSLRRAQEIRRAGEKAAQHVLANRFTEAEEVLRGLAGAYPDDSEIIRMQQQVARAGEEFTRRMELDRRSAAVDQACGQARLLAESGQFDPALEALRQTLATYPDDPRLKELAGAISHRKAQELIRSCSQLLREKRFSEAVFALTNELKRQPGEPALVKLRDQAKAEWEASKRAEGLPPAVGEEAGRSAGQNMQVPEATRVTPGKARDQTLLDAKTALRKGRLDEAEKLLKPIASRDPADSEVTAVLTEAQARRAAAEAEKAIGQGRQQAAQLAGQGQFDAAIQFLRELLERYGRQSGLDADLEETIAAKRQSVVTRLAASVRQAIAAKAWKIAAQWLDELARQYPDEPLLPELRENLQAERPRVGLEQALNEAEKALQRKDWAAAEESLAAAGAPDAPRLREFRARIDQGRARDRSLADAEAALRKGLLDEAEKLLKLLVARDAADSDAAALLIRVQAQRAATQAERVGVQPERARMAASVRQAIEQKDAQAAAQRLDELARRFPDEPLGALRASIQAELRRAWIEEAMAGAEKAIARGDWPAAEKCLALDPNSGRARELKARIANGKAREGVLIEAKAALAKGLFGDAEKLLKPLLASNPSDAPAAAMLQETQAQRVAAPAERARLVGAARQAIGQNNWNAASQQLDELGRRFPDELSLEALRKGLQMGIEEALAGAEKAIRNGDWPAAEKILGRLPDSARSNDLRARIFSVRTREQSLAEARTALGNGLFEEAERLLRALLKHNPADSEALAALRQAQVQRAAPQAEMARLAAQVRQAIQEKNWTGATEALEELDHRFPDAPSLAELRESLRAALPAIEKKTFMSKWWRR